MKKNMHTCRWLIACDSVPIDLQIKLAKNMVVGSDFEVYAVLSNNSMVAKSCSFMLFARAVLYNSTRGQSCGFISDPVTVEPGEGQW